MRAQVIYLNSWLNCPDDVLRFHYTLQDKINEGKATFWYEIGRQNLCDYQIELCYDKWIHSNRDRIRLLSLEHQSDDSEGVSLNVLFRKRGEPCP